VTARSKFHQAVRPGLIWPLMKRYDNCINGQDLAANDRIARALEDGGV
jgi:hypothetical protein